MTGWAQALADSARVGLRLRVVRLLVELREVSPDFRVTPWVRRALVFAGAAGTVLVAGLIGAAATLLPALTRPWGPPSVTVPLAIRFAGLAFVAHTLVAVSGRSARELSSPADAAILDHAGYSRRQVFVAREVAPAIGALLGWLAVVGVGAWWAVHHDYVGASAALSVGMPAATAALGATTLRVGLAAWLAAARPARLRSTVLAVLGAWAIGTAAGAVLSKSMTPSDDLRTVAVAALWWAVEHLTGIAMTVTGVLATAFGAWLCRNSRGGRWHTPLNAAPVASRRRCLTLPTRPWLALACLPVMALRERRIGDAADVVPALRLGAVVGAGALGLALGGEPVGRVSAEMAFGMAFAAPAAAAGAVYGVSSLRAHRRVLPVLLASGARLRVVGAGILGTAVLAAGISWGVLPVFIVWSELTTAGVVTAWLCGLVATPLCLAAGDCLLPGALTSTTPGRLRQPMPAAAAGSLLLAALGGGCWLWLRQDRSPAFVVGAVFAGCAAAVTVLRPPRGGFQ